MEDLLEKLVDQGLSLGADFIDLRLEKAIGTSIKIVDSKLKVGATSMMVHGVLFLHR
ncbi:MAG: hypothetical protein ACTSRP_17455 [Candidatus Helarchaeota archaeon]